MASLALVQRTLARLSRGFVLAFHDIPPDRLESLVESLRPIQPIPLGHLVERAKSGKSTRGLCAITVDDGVGETVRTLAELLQRRQWPATFYLPTVYVDAGEPMAFQWWRQVARLLPRKRLELRSGILDLSKPDAVTQLFRQLERMWHSRRIDEYLPLIMDLVEAVREQQGVTLADLEPPAAASWDQIAELSKNDLLQFESHGTSHTAMSVLNEDEVIAEMQESRDTISERTGRLCRHFAYPFGSRESIGPHAPKIARQFYDSAVTMSLGPVDSADPWLLPRIPLYAENSLPAAWLKVLLKCTAPGRATREAGWNQAEAPCPPARQPAGVRSR
jgi:peptidoglycan/xylan/chitin deacetylase (PgdA/CDA1 family)